MNHQPQAPPTIADIHEMAEVLRKNSLTEIDGDYLWLPQERRWATEEEHRDWLRKQNTIRGNER